MSRRHNDWVRSEASVPSWVLRVTLVGVVAVAALLLIPVIGWQLAAVIAVAVGMVVPHTFGPWIAMVCIAVGMLMSEPAVWRAMLAVLVVHICHAASSLLLAIPLRSRVILTALWPTFRRVLLVQLIAQPLTLIATLLTFGVGDAGAAPVAVHTAAPVIGVGALATFVVLVLMRLKRADRGS